MSAKIIEPRRSGLLLCQRDGVVRRLWSVRSSLVAGLLVVAVGVTVTGCSGSRGGAQVSPDTSASPSASVVPWVDQTAPTYTAPPGPTPKKAYRRCHASQLGGRAGRGGGAAGTFYQEIRLTNRSRQPCTLSGAPGAIIGVRASGRRVNLSRSIDKAVGANLIGPGPANLRPGKAGWLTLAYPDGCDAIMNGEKDDFTSLRILLDTSGRVRVDLPAPLNVVCGLSSSRFGAPRPSPQDTSRLNALSATVHLPAALLAGAIVGYTVTLHNKSMQDLALSPCPSYAEYLSPLQHLAQRVVQRYYLNCHAAAEIAAGGSLTFAMQMAVPNATGPAKYLWQLQSSNVTSGRGITIEPGS